MPSVEVAAAPPTSPDVEGKKVKHLYERADDLETKLNVASENGLFAHQKAISHKDILDKVTLALSLSLKRKLSPDDYSKAVEALDTGQNMYDTALQNVGRWRRLNYVYGIPTASYLLISLGIIAWFSLFPPTILSQPLAFLSIPLQILASGAVGGILRGVRALWSQVNRIQYRKLWATWFLLCPFMGALLGGIVYLTLLAGILVSTLSSTITNPSLAILVAVIAGYNWGWALEVIRRIPKIFSVSPEK